MIRADDERSASLSPSRFVRKARPLTSLSNDVRVAPILIAKTPTEGNSPEEVKEALIEPELGIRFRIQSEPVLVPNADDLLLPHGISDYTFVPTEAGGLLGKGKFSSVHIAFKGKKQYAVKHTPLYSHHPLIASRLLREPTILAQLPAHPNLVKVYETIRTPGHFYLVEEYLEGYQSLEDLVRTFPSEILPDDLALLLLSQLVEVVRSALHRPIFVCHRDIKPENIVVHPRTGHLVILDFGLATHYSERQAKLTTCCGSPAFHSPELFLNLKSPPGTVKYWGPEVDAWCIGVTLLRCLTGKRCPLGTSHTSIRHMADKATDALLSIPSQELRSRLAGLLDMNAENRMQYLKNFPLPPDYRRPDPANDAHTPQFKSTTFIPALRKHRLSLFLEAPAASISRSLSRLNLARSSSRDESQSRSRSTGPPSSRERASQYEITLRNPDEHGFLRAVSFLKYSLRCSGIVYHVWPSNAASVAFSVANTPDLSSGADPFAATPYERPSQTQLVYLRCVLTLPVDEGLLAAFRPPLLRSSTSAAARSSSTPPTAALSQKPEKKIRCLAFWMSITAPIDESYFPAEKPDGEQPEDGIPSKVVVRISDCQAMPHVKKALGLDSPIQTPATLPSDPGEQAPPEERGRSADKRPLLTRAESSDLRGGQPAKQASPEQGHALAIGAIG